MSNRVNRRKMLNILGFVGGSISVIWLGKNLLRKTSDKPSFEVFKESIGDTTLELVSIEGGSFLMGTPSVIIDLNERPQHEVTVQPFLMGRYEVTQAQWAVVNKMPKIDWEMKPDPSDFKGDNRPVEKVIWREAVEFCKRLSQATGREYRLPSEAEWEYACRAGTTTEFHFGDTLKPGLANVDFDGTNRQTTDVGSFPPNAFGLIDMHGNVMEWCQDDWHDNYEGAPTDGSAWLSPNSSEFRVLRGGAWTQEPERCRSAYRRRASTNDWSNSIGFRVVCASPWNL